MLQFQIYLSESDSARRFSLIIVSQDNISATHNLNLPTIDDNCAGLGHVASRKFRAARNATKAQPDLWVLGCSTTSFGNV